MKCFKKLCFLAIALIVFMGIGGCSCLGRRYVGCFNGCFKNYDLIDYGDFTCIRYRDPTNDKLTFFELSSKGKQKENLVITEYIRNRDLIFTRSLRQMFSFKGTPENDYGNHDFYFESENLKKLYISARDTDFCNTLGDLRDIISRSISNGKVPNLQKIIYGANVSFSDWPDSNKNIKTIVNDFVFEQSLDSYYNRNEYGTMKNCSVEYFESGQFKRANVQFLYNYENAPNEGYCWVDDIENGEKIEVMPTVSLRKGYKFGGWYADKECNIEFNFEQEIEKQAVEGFIYPENYVTYIYAKWIEI